MISPEMSKKTSERNELAHEAWGLLLVAHARLVRVMGEAMQAADVLPMEFYDVLLALSQAPHRRLRLNELADRIVFSRSGLTRLVDRLEAQGLLRRERFQDDRRGVFAVLTAAGDAALKRSWPAYEREIEARFAEHLSADEARVLRDALARLIGANGGAVALRESPPVQLTVRGKR